MEAENCQRLLHGFIIVSILKDEGYKPRVKSFELDFAGKRLSRIQP